jgi:TolA-binding protein
MSVQITISVDGQSVSDVISDGSDDVRTMLRQILKNQETVMASQEDLQREVDDLNSALATIGAGVSSLQANLQLAADELAKGASGLNVDTLVSAVDAAQNLASSFIVPAVDPATETPPAEEVPAPVEEAPAAEPVPTPSGDQTGGEGTTPEAGSEVITAPDVPNIEATTGEGAADPNAVGGPPAAGDQTGTVAPPGSQL